MRHRELRQFDQRWARQGRFVRRRRHKWSWILVAVVLGALGYALTQLDLGGLWESIQRRPLAPETEAGPQPEPGHLPLPPLDRR
ncbi:MAG: hypothetical protein WAK53_06220 [Chromatiaceae bacterium]